MQNEHIHYRWTRKGEPLKLFYIVLKHWRIVLSCILVGLLIGTIYCLVTPRKYESKALLRVKQNMMEFDSFHPIVANSQRKADEHVIAFRQILTSDEAMVSLRAYVDKFSPGISKEMLPNFESFIKSNVRIEPVNQTDLIRLVTSAQKPQLAEQLNDCLLKALQQILLKLNRSEQHAVTEFLESRLRTADVALDRAEDELRDFLVANRIFTPEQYGGFLDQNFAKLNNYFAENEIAESMTLNKLKTVKAQLKAIGVLHVATNSVTDSIQKSITDLEIEKIGYIGNYTNEHPRIKEIQKQIAELKKRLNVEIDNIIKLKAPSENSTHNALIGEMLQAESELAIIRGKKQVLAKLYEQNDKAIKALPELAQEYTRLKRRCDVATEIYTLLEKRHEESQIAEAMEIGSIQVVYHGKLPKRPTTQRKAKILLVLASLGGLLSIGFVLLKSALNPTIITENDIVSILGLPVLVTISEKKSFTDNLNDDTKKFLWKKRQFKVSDLKRNRNEKYKI